MALCVLILKPIMSEGPEADEPDFTVNTDFEHQV